MIGLDPEFSIVNDETGEAKSAHLVIGNDKTQFWFNTKKPGGFTEPQEDVSRNQLGSEYERDGAAIEIRNLAPTNCRDNFIPYFAEALRHVALRLPEGYSLSATPVYSLDDESVETAPKDVSEAGCRPDMSAYNLAEKAPSHMGREHYLGGHVHFSGTLDEVEVQAANAIALDYFIGLPLVAILGDRYTEVEQIRRNFYGQAGSFRYTDHLEYRVPSSLAFLSPVLLSWMTGTLRSISFGMWTKDTLKERLFPVLGPQGLREIIDNHDVAGAEQFYQAIFKAAPNYQNDESCLQYKLSGGGGSTYNPHFFMRSVDVFVAANNAGLGWTDDLRHNWGLEPDYIPEHHQYWGIHGAIAGQKDDIIFPMNAVLPEVIPGFKPSHPEPIFTHPKNPDRPGRKQYLSAGAPGWLL